MSIKINYNKSNGFTLIELLMVISIISLLASVMFSYLSSAKAKSRDAVRLSDMKEIGTAANMYYNDKDTAPSSIQELVDTGYLSAVPSDPQTRSPYVSTTTTSAGKRVFTASATYETIKRADGSPQQVGVVIGGDLTLADICALFKAIGSYPNCTDSGDSNDQIVGLTSGNRGSGSGGGSTNNNDNISDCSESQISKTCPNNTTNGCYCGGGKYANSLIWQYPDPNISMNWNDAKAYCENMGWRLPTVNELTDVLTNQFVNSNSYNLGGFNTNYWSSQEGNTYAYLVYYYLSVYYNDASKDNNNYVRCVK